MNGKFVEKYGAAWKDMDMDMKMMAIMSEIYDLREAIDPVRGICKVVDRHTLYWRVTIFFAVAVLGAVITKLIGVF